MKKYILFLTCLISGSLSSSHMPASASATAASSSSASTVLTQEQKNKALWQQLQRCDSDEVAAEVTRLLDAGAHILNERRLFTHLSGFYMMPAYLSSPKVMHALINHPSTHKDSVLWHNLQGAFIRLNVHNVSDRPILKALLPNEKFDENYTDVHQMDEETAQFVKNTRSVATALLSLRHAAAAEKDNPLKKQIDKK